MLSISSSAMEELALVLAENSSADGEQVIRMGEEDGELCLQIADRRPEDVVLRLDGRGLLCLERRLAADIGKRRLELLERPDGVMFCLVADADGS